MVSYGNKEAPMRVWSRLIPSQVTFAAGKAAAGFSRRLLPALLAPALFVCLAGQDFYVGSMAEWNSYDSVLVEAARSLPVVKSGNFQKSGLDLATCMSVVYEVPAGLSYACFIDTSDNNHTLFAVTRTNDTSDVKWALTTQGKGLDIIQADLRSTKALSSSDIGKIWKSVDKCGKMQ